MSSFNPLGRGFDIPGRFTPAGYVVFGIVSIPWDGGLLFQAVHSDRPSDRHFVSIPWDGGLLFQG